MIGGFIIEMLVLTASVWLATKWLLRWLQQRQILDRPNERSSHATPTPRGGGLALVPLLLLAWILLLLAAPISIPGFWLALGGALLLALISWQDDRRGLSAALRFGVQIIAVGLGLFGLADVGLFFQGLLPYELDRLAAGFLWLWFINLFNFMDGIDGITGVEAGSLAVGMALVAFAAPLSGPLIALPLLLLAAVIGFLPWNWPPAKLFLGDVGSVPLGYLLGWLLLLTAAEGQWAAAIILPLYYWSDAGLTLAKRALAGKKVWQAHREHAYQRAVQGGLSHAQVSLAVFTCNAVLVALAGVAAVGWPWPAVALAIVVVAGFMIYLERHARAL